MVPTVNKNKIQQGKNTVDGYPILQYSVTIDIICELPCVLFFYIYEHLQLLFVFVRE